jgi:hypothetical protein
MKNNRQESQSHILKFNLNSVVIITIDGALENALAINYNST